MHPTGIDVVQSLEDHYRHATLAPFHFIPSRSFAELEGQENFTRADYRCVSASDKEKAVLIHEIMDEAVAEVKESRCEKNLMRLGMALHTYADTYAHCGYSGLTGWENKAVIKKAFNQMTGKEEVSEIERLFYKKLPHIGHGNSGHVPDICSYQIDVALPAWEDDQEYSEHIERNNLERFLECSRSILDFLCGASGREPYDDGAWADLSEKLSVAMLVRTSEESSLKKTELATHWKEYFPDIDYSYEKNERFYRKKQGTVENSDSIVHYPAQAFYDYNELSYRRAKKVLGLADRFEMNRQLLTEAVQEAEENRIDGEQAGVEQPDESQMEVGQTDAEQPGEFQAGAEQPDEIRVDASQADTETAGGSREKNKWVPKTELGFAVHAAGFDYSPEKDILCSTMDNVQREFGYCRGYDEAALAISAVIDCEPVYFIYDGLEWMIELWKGQYNIGTGCEIGVYYRDKDQPETELEKTVTGKMYSCVPDEKRLEMRFSLRRDGKKLYERDWTKHWWLTGFRWGIFSRPEQLAMSAGLRFPNAEMKEAFLTGACGSGQKKEGFGLKALGYNYEEPDELTVEFEFGKPYTVQPAIRSKAGDTMQKLNEELVNAYNKIKEKYHIDCNDPDVIDEVLTGRAGLKGKKLHEKLILHYQRKTDFRKNVGRPCG